MAVVSRLQLNHPALGTTGGAALHASIEALYQKIGDSISSRWFAIADFDNGEVVDLKHDFSTDIANLRYDIYVQVSGEWVVLTNETSPARSAFTLAEKSGAEGSTLQITNVSGGNNLEVAVALVNDPIYLQQGDVKDVDISGAEDGQALVYQSSSKKFVPGASGDSSFKLQSISTPNAVIKGGYILLQDGRELATHDGSGSLQADFGQDLTINLTTVLGSAPANATTYYLYVDLHSLSASVTTTDTGRVLYAVTQSNFKLLTTKPELVDQSRYIPRGLIKSATTGTAWSGAGSYFTTLAFLAAKGEAEDNLLIKVYKAGHGFTASNLGTPMYLLGGTYTTARADSSDMAEVVGLVHSVVDTDYFYLATGGRVPLTTTVTGGESITAGKVFFLSATNAGRLTATEPSVVGQISKPVGICVDTGNIMFYNYRGSVIGASNVRTQISLANNATTTVQNVSAYEAGELSGWVSIAATTSLKFYVSAQFAKNGAGTDYNLSYQTTGDTPPTGFNMTVTAAGLIQIVMPSVTGFASASINYGLNVAAVGVTLPLSIPSSGIVWSEPVAFRNKIINGNFDIWQRGTSQTATGYGSDDRWVNDHAGSTKTASRQAFTIGQTDISGNPKYFSRTIVSSVAGANNLVIKTQRIEGAATLSGQNVKLSFWAKADASKNIAIEFAQSFGTGGSPSAAVTGIGVTTFGLTTSWKKFTVTTILPSVSGKTLGTNNDDSLQVLFWFDAGSSFNARTNSLGQQSGTFDIAQVQVEEGTIATPFEQRPIGTELQLCQRYFWQAAFTGPADILLPVSMGIGASSAVLSMNNPVEMRAKPSSVSCLVSVANANASVIAQCQVGSNLSSSLIWGANLSVTNGVTLTANSPYRTLINGSGYFINANAEL